MITKDSLCMLVVAETGAGLFLAIGQMVTYEPGPGAMIRLPDGSLSYATAAFVREATPTEAAIVQTLAPAQNECFHDKNICGRLTRTLLLCGRCKKAVEE